MIRKQQLIWIRPADNRVIIILWKSHNNCSSFIRLVLCNLINRLEKMTNHSVLAMCSITIEHCQSDFGAKMLRMQSKNPQWPTKKKVASLCVCVLSIFHNSRTCAKVDCVKIVDYDVCDGESKVDTPTIYAFVRHSSHWNVPFLAIIFCLHIDIDM